MGFWLRTPNTSNDVQKKKIFVGRNIENAQVWVLGACSALAAYFAIYANVSVLWRAAGVGAAVYSWHAFSKMTKWRTEWSRFRMFARKASSPNSAVDRGADYSYFDRSSGNGKGN